MEWLIEDCNELLAFYDFPAERWKDLSTAKVTENAFVNVRHRTVRSKGASG